MTNFAYENLVVDIPDYPKPGVVFKDVLPIIGDGDALRACVDAIAEHFSDKGITRIIGSEARGFLVGAPLAYAMGVGFIAARKAGKLPRETFTQSYELEYGSSAIEIHTDALEPSDKVLVVDDILATGGTSTATAKLIEQAGAEVAGFAFLMELSFLNPRDILSKEFPHEEVFSLIEVG